MELQAAGQSTGLIEDPGKYLGMEGDVFRYWEVFYLMQRTTLMHAVMHIGAPQHDHFGVYRPLKELSSQRMEN